MIQRRATAGGIFCAAGNPAGKVDHFPIGVDGFDKEAINNNGLPSCGVQRRAGSPKRTLILFLEVTPSDLKWRFPLNS